ncbi:MAG: DNA polymerase II large subunit [Candidatus Hermodarchaeia archaeon]|jgi:DNA polymerase II large subunit
MQLTFSNTYKNYFLQIEKQIKELYEIAKSARGIGLDPSFAPEPHLARDLGEMVEGLVGPVGIAERIRELTVKKIERHEMAFIIALDIIHAKFGHTDQEEAAEQAIKTSLAVMTGGITAAPIQGISQVKIKANLDHTQYLAIYFAGPIRSAAGTEQALTLVVGDFIRRKLGLDRYKPVDEEIRRYIEEIRLYEREVSRFQYHVSDEELEYSVRNLPVEPTGTETDPFEVSSYRNLPRIETNRIRAGALRIINDGIVGRSRKVLGIVETLGLEGWEWLKRVKEANQDNNQKKEHMYMEDVIAGRPIFAFPSQAGGFRLRYGRARNTGLAAVGIHPATMIILDNFLASGTQIRVEGPGKGGIVVPVDSIEPPLVRLDDGSVIRINNVEEALQQKDNVAAILFLGDLLIGYGEFLENNKSLSPSGYVEEWWAQDVKAALQKEVGGSIEIGAKLLGISPDRLTNLIRKPLQLKPTLQEALLFAQKLNTPLHPRFTYFWNNIAVDEVSLFRKALIKRNKNANDIAQSIELINNEKVKTILERLGVEHEIVDNKIVLNQDAHILIICLQTESPEIRLRKQNTTVETIAKLSGLLIRDKAPTFIGARMGRPEKARKRAMSPLVHGLFPVGLAGGPQRNVLKAVKKGLVQIDLVRRKCLKCGIITHQVLCSNCGSHTVIERKCPNCDRVLDTPFCRVCRRSTVGYDNRSINLGKMFKDSYDALGLNSIEIVKGVRGLMSADKVPELLEKGVLRAKYALSIYKDGTIRFDATNAPLTHFKPKEIGLSIAVAKSLGYHHDIHGNSLQEPDQRCELKIQDVILPKNCADYLIRATQFIDELLIKVYKLPTYYQVKHHADLIGHLIVGFAPHTSAGIIGRIIGFTEANVCYAHPLWHNIKRRDCDGDEDAIMLTLDVLLNFSKSFLPSRIGGMMDAPLLLLSNIDPFEVDETHNMDVVGFYPQTFFEKTLERTDPKIVKNIINIVEHRLGTASQFEGYKFTHRTSDLNAGNLNSSYMTLGAMSNKLDAQLQLAEKIIAVNAKEVAQKVLTTHLLRDIAGNLTAFTRQKMRCKKCNAKYRRIPLSGKCLRCGSDLLPTVYRKGIEKYLDVAENLIQKYKLDNYYQQRITLMREEISSLFPEEFPIIEDEKQLNLGAFM